MASWQGWEQQLLRALGVPVTRTNVNSLAEWQRREGGTATHNPLNTTQSAPGAGKYNSVGVRNYNSVQQGLQATVKTLKNGHYGDILGALRASQPLGSQSSLKVWGTGTWSGGGGGDRQAAAVPTPPSPTGLTPSAPPSFTKEDAMRQGLGALASGTYDPVKGLAALRKASEAAAAATVGMKGQNYLSQAFPVMGPAGSKFGAKAARMVQDYLGTPYVWGGESLKGFDCSGLLQWVWKKLGVSIPRTTYDQIGAGRKVGRNQLRPGDAVFFGTKDNPHHVGMFIGGGQFIEAPHTGAVVRISNLRGRTDYLTARRYA